VPGIPANPGDASEVAARFSGSFDQHGPEMQWRIITSKCSLSISMKVHSGLGHCGQKLLAQLFL
jgi:hypothetical protein